jgi:hypothetical protein
MMEERNVCEVLDRKSEKLLLTIGLRRHRIKEYIRSGQEDGL